ncbi:MAG: AAA family ATPase [Candidatus Aenigmarchaeota archaeon]|nr:AAA family ATPase [Candidatus Aenigmarchaeota archaeon]
MTKIISICSGKGGVGKTLIAANLGAMLHRLNKSVVIIDFNLTTSHLGLSLGIYSPNRTINNFLRNEAKLEDAIYLHSSGLRIVPASLELNDLNNIETEGLKEKIKDAFKGYDFVLLDSAPGIGREALIALKACDEAIFVATPHVTSVVDVLKMKNLSSILGFQNVGIVLNRVQRKKYELSDQDVFRFTELPVIASIAEDEKIMECTNSRSLSVLSYPRSASSKAFFYLAHRVAGLPVYNYGSWR